MINERRFNTSEELARQIDIAMNKSKELEEIIADIKNKVSAEEAEQKSNKVVADSEDMNKAEIELTSNPTFMTMFALLKAFVNLNNSVKQYVKEMDEKED